MDKKFIIGVFLTTLAIIFLGIFLLQPKEEVSAGSLVTAGTFIQGDKNSKIELVEFSDFECPACLAAKPYIDEILKKYGDKIIFGYRHFPLPKHKYAMLASLASEAAGEQGKFWEMHEYLFDNQENLSDEFINQSGKEIGLNDNTFKEALKSSKVKEKVLKDIAQANNLKVNSTPTFFINGRKLNIKSFNDIEQAIIKELNK